MRARRQITFHYLKRRRDFRITLTWGRPTCNTHCRASNPISRSWNSLFLWHKYLSFSLSFTNLYEFLCLYPFLKSSELLLPSLLELVKQSPHTFIVQIGDVKLVPTFSFDFNDLVTNKLSVPTTQHNTILRPDQTVGTYCWCSSFFGCWGFGGFYSCC